MWRGLVLVKKKKWKEEQIKQKRGDDHDWLLLYADQMKCTNKEPSTLSNKMIWHSHNSQKIGREIETNRFTTAQCCVRLFFFSFYLIWTCGKVCFRHFWKQHKWMIILQTRYSIKPNTTPSINYNSVTNYQLFGPKSLLDCSLMRKTGSSDSWFSALASQQMVGIMACHLINGGPRLIKEFINHWSDKCPK